MVNYAKKWKFSLKELKLFPLHRINIRAASAAIRRTVITAKNIIKYSIGISVFEVPVK